MLLLDSGCGVFFFFFFQAEDGIRDYKVTGVQTCALPIWPDGDLEWLTKRPAPKGFYGIGKFMNSIDTKLLGRKTYDLSVQMGATFDTQTPHCVFSRRPAPASVPAGDEFISEAIGAFAKRLRTRKGQDIW